jgi:hypothetical protein
MIWLTTFSERAYNYAHRHIPLFTETQRIAVDLVMGHVHPGNMGALPPSPDVLLHKARILGLL